MLNKFLPTKNKMILFMKSILKKNGFLSFLTLTTALAILAGYSIIPAEKLVLVTAKEKKLH